MMPGAARYNQGHHGERYSGNISKTSLIYPWENQGPASYRSGGYAGEDEILQRQFDSLCLGNKSNTSLMGEFREPRFGPSSMGSMNDRYGSDDYVPPSYNDRGGERMYGFRDNLGPSSRQDMLNRSGSLRASNTNRFDDSRTQLEESISNAMRAENYQRKMANTQQQAAVLQGRLGGFGPQVMNRQGYQSTPHAHPVWQSNSRMYDQMNSRPISAPGYQKLQQNYNNRFGNQSIASNFGTGSQLPYRKPMTPDNVRHRLTGRPVFSAVRRPKLAVSSRATGIKSKVSKAKSSLKPEQKKGKDVGSPKKSEDGSKEESNEKGEEAPKVIVPLEAFHCVICNVDKFETKKAFYAHIKGESHKEIADAYHSKRSSQMEYLEKCSKLSVLRHTAKLTRETGETPKKPPKTVENRIYQQYRKLPDCCGRKFETQYMREEHMVSSAHLAQVYLKKIEKEAILVEKEEANKENDKTNEDKKEGDEPTDDDDKVNGIPERKKEGIKEIPSVLRKDLNTQKILELLEESKEVMVDVPAFIKKYPAYDPNVLVGLDYIEAQQRYRFYCSLCKRTFTASETADHAQSEDHYNKIIEHFEEKREAEAAEKRKKRFEKQTKAAEEKKKEEEEASAEMPDTPTEGKVTNGHVETEDENKSGDSD